jgi:hypothetical protein
MHILIRVACSALLALTGVAVARTAIAQEYPTRPITYIMPFAGGSASDVVSRIMLNKMSKSMGQPIIVDNRPGAGGNIGTAIGAKAAPDGNTLIGGGSGPVAANLTLYKVLAYDPMKDLEMISPFAGFTHRPCEPKQPVETGTADADDDGITIFSCILVAVQLDINSVFHSAASRFGVPSITASSSASGSAYGLGLRSIAFRSTGHKKSSTPSGSPTLRSAALASSSV